MQIEAQPRRLREDFPKRSWAQRGDTWGMDEQTEQNDFENIVVEDAASEPGGCLGVVVLALAVAAIIVVVLSQ